MSGTALRTRFTDLVGCTAPIQFAPMGGDLVTVDLAKAVCRAGGFGCSTATTSPRSRLDSTTWRQRVLAELFSVGWPDAPHRVLTVAVEAAQRADAAVVGSLGERDLPGFSAQVPGRQVTGNVGAMALYAGQGVGAVREVVTAEQVVRDMTDGAHALLTQWDAD
jgi:NAD(P)H-dependent flavin oxidoreductase YrpB (nitropropane dioxygenase family)